MDIFIEDNSLTSVKEIEQVNELFRFINDDKQVDRLLTEFEVSEDQEIDFTADYIEISFDEDTSSHNEGGSNYGGYQYIFTINAENGTFNGLEVINHN